MPMRIWRNIEYRVDSGGDAVALIFHGGHMRANIDLGGDFFRANGFKTLVPSRPGYGKTPIEAGRTTADFADAMADFVRHHHAAKVIVVGISAGGPTALQFAQRYPELTDALILQSSIGHNGWPGAKIRLGARIAFNHVVEKYVWSMMRLGFALFPIATLKMMLASLSVKEPEEALKTIRADKREGMIEVLKQSRSGRGFLNDLSYDVGSVERISAPTLIIHSTYDASVDASHPNYLLQCIPNSTLCMSEAESHMFWFSDHYPAIERAMRQFIAAL
jgi:pimeloyl-ACP methyl ester carboxylesterase